MPSIKEATLTFLAYSRKESLRERFHGGCQIRILRAFERTLGHSNPFNYHHLSETIDSPGDLLYNARQWLKDAHGSGLAWVSG